MKTRSAFFNFQNIVTQKFPKNVSLYKLINHHDLSEFYRSIYLRDIQNTKVKNLKLHNLKNTKQQPTIAKQLTRRRPDTGRPGSGLYWGIHQTERYTTQNENIVSSEGGSQTTLKRRCRWSLINRRQLDIFFTQAKT